MAPTMLSSAMSKKRIQKEIADLRKEDMGLMQLAPSETDMFLWTAAIPGPEGSPYEGGMFKLTIKLEQDYPFSAPKVMFTTRIYHMNVSDRGGICIDILKQNWSPALSLFKVLLSLSSLLTDPNPKDPLVPTIAIEYMKNRKKHDATAREWTKLYALPPKPIVVAPPPPAKPSPAKGKARVVPNTQIVDMTGDSSSGSAVSSRRPQATRTTSSRAAVTIPQEVIDIGSDSDGEDGAPPPARAMRANAGSKRKRGAEGEDTSSTSARAKRGRAAGQTAGTGVGGSRAGAGDVIVIDD